MQKENNKDILVLLNSIFIYSDITIESTVFLRAHKPNRIWIVFS